MLESATACIGIQGKDDVCYCLHWSGFPCYSVYDVIALISLILFLGMAMFMLEEDVKAFTGLLLFLIFPNFYIHDS
jgi:hypothetical protein